MDLQVILAAHKLWRQKKKDGKRADLSRANLSEADLRWANLAGADLRWADLREANLSRANLSEADLRWANLRGADLSRAVLCRAVLSGADLRKAALHGVDLAGANLGGANLVGTCLDPSNVPNGQVDGFERDGDYVIGYRTAVSYYVGSQTYEVGQAYTAPVFSTAETACHPGLYLSPTPEAAWASTRQGLPLVVVRALASDVHRAGDKYRARRLEVLRVFESVK